MGWTEAERYITKYDEIVQYLDEQDAFHDYRIGHLEHEDADQVSVYVEEVLPGKKLQDMRITSATC